MAPPARPQPGARPAVPTRLAAILLRDREAGTASVPAPGFCLLPRGVVLDQRLPYLEHRLQAAQHHHPARARDAFGRLRRALELVVGDGEETVPAVLRLDLPRHPARGLVREVGVVERLPPVDEPPRRVV